MKISPSGVAGVTLLGPGSEEFELALAPLLGRAPRELLAPALPYSVIVANDGGRSIALLGVRFNMTGPYAKQYSVIHYADSLRNPDKADFLAGTKRFVCAEPSFTALLLRRDGDLSSRGRSNLDNLRRMLDIQASLDCIAWDDGRFEGPDTQGAFERLERQREMERMFVDQTPGMSLAEAEKLLLEAAEDPKDRARRAIARKLLEGLQSGGRDGMLEVARNHRLKIGVWREGGGRAYTVIHMLKTILVLITLSVTAAFAQPPAGASGGRGRGAPPVMSPEVSADRQVTFRISAPQAQSVRIGGGDIPNSNTRGMMTKGANGVWEVTIGPLEPGAYRYSFNVDGLTVVDPRNGAVSESLSNVWSLVVVPGSDYFDTKEVPHGAVASITYYSTALKKFRRMHVYTPPGYEMGKDKYPVFYLLHGSGDNDDAWTSVGRAGFIFDNLIAEKKAKPMVVVMPASHTQNTTGGGGGGRSADPNVPAPPDEFTQDFLTDLMPYAESHYRIITDRAHRAIAGLSLGGSQTLNIVIPHLNEFSYIGVFSSGLLGAFGGGGRGGRGPAAASGPLVAAPAGPPAVSAGATLWEQQHMAELDNAAWKKGLKLVWFSTGKDDSLITTSRGTVELLNKHGYNASFHESEGAHTWLNWRNYLVEFTPQLFQ